ncbi:hypothetical protein B10174_06410 [Campylobacter jejuni]|nr:hypothetical protein B10174_06410 [Campylobacter jejuni]
MDKICKKFVSKAGFSKGMLELAPKKPPLFVPKCFIDSRAATGPVAML